MKCTNESHEALKQSPLWSSLKPAGVWLLVDDDGNDESLEMRNCQCGSTLARPLVKEAA